MLCDHLCERSHLFDPDGCFWAEFYPYCSDGWWGGIGVRGRGWRGVFFYHGCCGPRGEIHLLSAVRRGIVRAVIQGEGIMDGGRERERVILRRTMDI